MSKHPANDARPYTETSALQDILQWSKTRPDWLRDALRRLMVASELSDLDIDELEALCLGTGGDASPLSDEHIAPQRLAGKPVAITGLRDPVAVNALARGQGVSFAATGLTIVYGDNGSGKSGFVRVLKSACRSRDDKTSILPDVTAADDIPQSARIEFQVAGNADTYEWRPEHGDHADLSAVSIFEPPLPPAPAAALPERSPSHGHTRPCSPPHEPRRTAASPTTGETPPGAPR